MLLLSLQLRVLVGHLEFQENCLINFFLYSSLHKIIPPRGPRKVLCVVVVTKSAYSTGFGCKPAATNPAM